MIAKPSDATRAASRREADRDHFDTIAESYARKDLRASSRCARVRRLERTLETVPMQPSWRLLEVGCGAGFAASYLAGRYRQYVGIDQSPRLVEIATAVNGSRTAEFVAAGVEDLSPAGDFDLAFMVGVLHHLADPQAAVVRMVGMLRPGGYLAVNEPRSGSRLISTARRLRARVDTGYSDDQDELSRQELLRTLEGAGLEDVTVSPQGLLSTPFAEVPLGPQLLTAPAARFACAVDRFLESRAPFLLGVISWNLVAVGRRPGAGAAGHDAGGRG